ncbi:RelA/SpoT family protein [[Clostridium] polysaccharolyticum]|uniref:GTP diphosphokinase n=1 Tax=[Clostridium] polysaccharolyticum TaxID=29364 RepID=A0A1I0AZN3_9FIRM|nr:bifunctional (p)ppGpp synthetase/guanosine-3',5'-bis(diphosphate) 3'-pyrophosphohydrolase [[Clostridium] polysaccharolyticum]SES99709.1 GTP pyrophosphokinase [[Clostridium] polysaccharolyticum]
MDEKSCEHIGMEELTIWKNENTLIKPDNYMEPEELYTCLIECIRKYHPSSDLTMIERAYAVAKKAHQGQVRKSGEPYIIHPLCVGLILTDLKLDKESISAGLLHDVVEDTDMTIEEVKEIFGEEVAFLVDGVTKLGQISDFSDKTEEQAENLKKMFIAMAKDIRVLLIKLADRLHNIRTLNFRKPEKQVKVARETIDIYAPLAQRLGISKVKMELDDLSLMYLKPAEYQELVRRLNETKQERDLFIKTVVGEVKETLEQNGVKGQVSGHLKHLFSIYRKMVNQNDEHILDAFSIQVIVPTVRECYQALGVLHEMFTPVPGKFKDFIAMPKPNMYQSLHTTLVSRRGRVFKVQIRTEKMHMVSQYGITALWKYREGKDQAGEERRSEEKLIWLKQILEWQNQMSDNKEFMSSIKSDFDLLSEQIYCFTPAGDVKNLPSGANVIDFAYSIHSAVGNKMVGARVNNEVVPIDYIIKNGDRVEIITSQNSRGPSYEWTRIVKTTQAKNRIHQWYHDVQRESNIERGKELLKAYCKARGIARAEIWEEQYKRKIVQKYGVKDWDSILASIGHGGLKEGQIVNKLIEEYEKEHQKIHFTTCAGGVVVKNVGGAQVRFAKCCCPVPFDEIIGYQTNERGVTIHRTDCDNILSLPEAERRRLVSVEWKEGYKGEKGKFYAADITMTAKNRTGILADVTEILYKNRIDVQLLNSKTSSEGVATIQLSFQVESREQLNGIMQQLSKVNNIVKIERN